jgi:hypothetical protein
MPPVGEEVVGWAPSHHLLTAHRDRHPTLSLPSLLTENRFFPPRMRRRRLAEHHQSGYRSPHASFFLWNQERLCVIWLNRLQQYRVRSNARA